MGNRTKKPDWAIRAERIMKKSGLIQEDLLETFGVTTRGAVGHYFTGRSQVTIDQLELLATLLDTTSIYLLTGTVPDINEDLIRKAIHRRLVEAVEVNWITIRDGIPIDAISDLIVRDYRNLTQVEDSSFIQQKKRSI